MFHPQEVRLLVAGVMQLFLSSHLWFFRSLLGANCGETFPLRALNICLFTQKRVVQRCDCASVCASYKNVGEELFIGIWTVQVAGA